MSVYSIRFSGDQCRTCQSSDGPVRFYYSHFPTHGMEEHDHVYVSCPHHGLFPLPNDGRWTIESVHPLTVSPSIDFGPCGCHGFIRGGKWVSATSTPNARTACIDAALDGEQQPSAWRRNPACVERWPECSDGEYNPACCRFPKPCSCDEPADAALDGAE